MNRVFLSLGSNINNKVDNLNKAVALLKKNEDIHNLKVSSFYSTDPVGYLDQDVFVNIVVEMYTELRPIEVLNLCQKIEKDLLRERLIHWGPRTIDLDIILYGTINLNTKELIIPHERACERAFVLVPLLELDNELEINGVKIKEVLKTIDKTGVRKI